MDKKTDSSKKQRFESTSNVSDIFEHAIECIARIDRQGNYLSVNAGYAEVYGYMPEDMKGMCWKDTIHQDDIDSAENTCKEMLEVGRSEVNLRGIRKNATVFYNHIVMVKGLENDKSPVSHYCFIQDITDQTLEERKLFKEVEFNYQKFQRLIELQPECFKQVGKDGELSYMNSAGLKMIEADSLQQVKGLCIYDLIAEEYREKFILLNQRVFAGETVVLEFEIEGLKGARRWMETHACPVKDSSGLVLEHLAVTRDITERKQAELALHEREQHYSTLINDIDAIVWEVSLPDLLFTFVSESAKKILGYPLDDWYQENFWLDHIHPDDRDAAYHYCADQTARGKNHQFEYRMFAADGSIVWIKDLVDIVQDESDSPDKLRGVMFNITPEKETEERFSLAMEGASDGLWDWNLETNYIYYSPRWKSMLGYEGDDIPNTVEACKALLHPDDLDKTFALVDDYIYGRTNKYSVEFRMRHKDGHYVDILSRGFGVKNNAGDVIRMVGTHVDISEQKRISAALAASESQFRTLYDDTPAMFFNTSKDGTILNVNEYGANHLGYIVNDLKDKNVTTIIHKDDIGIAQKKLKQCFEMPDIVHHWNLRKVHKDGHIIMVRETVRVVNDVQGEPSLFIVCEDISEAFRLSEELSYQATHDALTGLVNRSEFERRLQRVIEANQSTSEEHAICYLDLDQFKIINDTCGHLAGDELLRQLSEILLSKVRKRDTLARLGGDEFGVLMEHCDIAHARRVTESLRVSVEEFRFVWQDKRFSIGVSIGLVPISVEIGNVNEVLSAADAACYAAKDAGRNRVHVYSADDKQVSQHRGEMKWVPRINQALEEELFVLYYQKIMPIDQRTEQGDHYELLIRMLGEGGEIIPPGAFLPAAERFGLSTKIDHWVVDSAFSWLATHPAKQKKLELCTINLSGQTLGNNDFMKFLINKLDENLVTPSKICFEITETSAIANLANAIRFIKTIKDKGCRFALDDFGSGVSSFGYLKNLPVDFLKIDGAFVRDIETDRIDRAMVKSINEIGQIMGKKTIAEFVENDAILQELKKTGVDYVQGYGIAKPRALRNTKRKK